MAALRPMALVFALSFAFIWWLTADRLVFINDEGIFLAHAARIADGAVLYRDLFGLTGPASYWLLALMFKLFGVSLKTAHFILAMQVAAITTVIHSVTLRLADRTSAAIGALAFLVFTASDPQMMTNNHRWDADTYAILGIVAIWRGRPLLGGVLLALSVWATPVFAITATATVGAAWLIGQSPWRVIAGGAAGAMAGVLALLLTGGLQGFIDGLLWAKSNYSDINRMPYGAIVGGYPALFEDAAGAEIALRAVLVFGLTISAWLPPLAGVLTLASRDRNLIYFLVCGVSMLIGVSPRYDIGHLIFAAPLFYPIAASFLQRARWAVVPVGVAACLFLLFAVVQRMSLVEVSTPVGVVRTDRETAKLTKFLTANIKPGEKVFAFPYIPVVYFLTRAQNVSRFCFLMPGFHTERDERVASADMERTPPAKIVYLDTPIKEYMRVWPAADPARLRLKHLEEFVGARYQPSSKFGNFTIYTAPVRASIAAQ
jgi:hypothetical protein